MGQFLDDNFLLTSDSAKTLYHEFASPMPIIDYHCHLNPEEIADDRQFTDITELWLAGDHYKWRAMRANGVDESYCTGQRTNFEKFQKWADTVPYTIRNPLYHWTHLELQRYFGIHEVLDTRSSGRIYQACNEALATPEYSVRNLLTKMRVEVICTTDDPVDDLRHHKKIREDGFEIRVFPTFRPDKAMEVENPQTFNLYLNKLEKTTNRNINSYRQYLESLKSRHDFFATMGCSLSDHGLEAIDADDYTEREIDGIFSKIRGGTVLNATERSKIRSALLFEFAQWNHEKKWVQQYHLGAMRNNNKRMMRATGPDSGWDSVADLPQGAALGKFLDSLDADNKLTKTIIYNLNPAFNSVFATMIGNFNDGSVAGKIQWGSAWWFLDQKDGMKNQLNTLSNMGILAKFIGMITDSRSFISYPRHEYFRRILCNLIGGDIDYGELPNDIEWFGKIVKDICYYNSKQYFEW
ncbi:MAG TPA: glucuronate isomerase [Puia sp.]|nr:glucuronate isomerase [Puia sp.]